MNISVRALALASAVALVGLAPATPTRAADGIFGSLPAGLVPEGLLPGWLIGGGNPPPPPPPPTAPLPAPEVVVPAPQAGMYVPVSPPGMVTYPGYTAAYPNTACRGAYWARKPIFNADGLLIGYSRPQYMCPQWY
jgi:hypothetical protein